MQETITRDVLFVGATRPPMIAGVTMEVYIINVMSSAIIFLAIGNPLYILIGIPIHAISYLICLDEPRRFRLLFLKLKLMSNQRNRMKWQCHSYSPFEEPVWDNSEQRKKAAKTARK